MSPTDGTELRVDGAATMSILERASHTNYIRRLGELIQSGECVLFLGAGVSLDSGAPSGWQLANELGEKFYGYERGQYPLDEVCELIDATEGRRVLNEWL